MRSVVVVLPASMCAMIPMLRVLARRAAVVLIVLLVVGACGVVVDGVGGAAWGPGAFEMTAQLGRRAGGVPSALTPKFISARSPADLNRLPRQFVLSSRRARRAVADVQRRPGPGYFWVAPQPMAPEDRSLAIS